MGGFFGVASQQDCVFDLFFGTDYHSHLGTRRGGMAVFELGFGDLDVEEFFDGVVALEYGVIDELTVHFFGIDFVAGVPVIAGMKGSQEHDFFTVVGLVGKFGNGTGFFRFGFNRFGDIFGSITGSGRGFFVGAGI